MISFVYFIILLLLLELKYVRTYITTYKDIRAFDTVHSPYISIYMFSFFKTKYILLTFL